MVDLELSDIELVDSIFARARTAQQRFEMGATQTRYDTAALAVGWAIMQPERNAELSQMAVETTGLGNVADKITKNHRKTLGVLRDIQKAKTHGVIGHDAQSGITEIARPKGVIGAVVPSTNPVATPANNALNALKCGNAIVLSPSPRGVEVCARLLSYIHEQLDRVGIERDLVQMIPAPVNKVRAQRLMEIADLLVVTGSQNNVRRAYSSGTPSLGVGAGNVSVIVDETADLASAARKIAASKCFDNATSCSSENSIVIVDAVFGKMMEHLHQCGGRMLDEDNAAKFRASLFGEHGLNPRMIAQEIDTLIATAQISVDQSDSAKFLLLHGRGIGEQFRESGEKLSRVATVYRASDFEDAKDICTRIMAYQGRGHSVGIHTSLDERAMDLGSNLPTCRVIVNQAHCFATGGSFDNGLPFSLSMGCGSWGGNSIDENFNYRHLLNITRVARPIPANEPSLDQIFSDYWCIAGK